MEAELRTIKGKWKFTNEGSKRYDGELCIEKNSLITLKISLTQEDGIRLFPLYPVGQEISYVHGISNTGQPIILENSTIAQDFWLREDMLMRVQIAQIGDWQTKSVRSALAPLNFERLTCDFYDFDIWVDKFLFNISDKKRTIKYNAPESTKMKFDSDWEIVMKTFVNRGFNRAPGSISLKQSTVLEFKPPHPQSFSEIIDRINAFRSFVGLFSIHPLGIRKITGFLNDKEYVDIYYEGMQQKLTHQKYLKNYFFINYKDIECFSDVLENYPSECMNEDKAFILFNFISRCENLPIPSRFFLLFQSLEAFHRGSSDMKQNELDDAEFKKRLDAVLDVCPGNYRKWVERKLDPDRANDRSAPERLKELAGKTTCLFKDGKEKNKDIEEFIGYVVKARNAHTHKPELRKEDGKKMHFANERLNFMLRVLLLKKVGFPDEKIDQLMAGNDYVRQLRKKWFSMEWPDQESSQPAPVKAGAEMPERVENTGRKAE